MGTEMSAVTGCLGSHPGVWPPPPRHPGTPAGRRTEYPSSGLPPVPVLQNKASLLPQTPKDAGPLGPKK